MLASLSTTAEIAQLYFGVILLMSLFTFGVYGWDKRAAQKETWRVPEKSLHLLELFGGWPGALAAQKVFRHKTQKRMFQFITFAIAALHLIVLGVVIWRWSL